MTLTREHFEARYAADPDPWDFEGSAYERAKYERTLAALGERRYASAFEAGCSIGVFTAMLADRCDELLAVDIAIVANQAYFTTLGVEGDELVFRTNFGLKLERVPLGALQRIDAKRYPGAHSGVSAPFFVARGRDTTVRVNTKPYRLKQFIPLIGVLQEANPRVQLDEFWTAVAAGKDITKEIVSVPRSRM